MFLLLLYFNIHLFSLFPILFQTSYGNLNFYSLGSPLLSLSEMLCLLLICWLIPVCHQLMVRSRVPVCTSESLRIFPKGYITVYLAHTVAPGRLLRCISTPPGNFITAFPSGKYLSLSKTVNIGIIR